MNSHELFIKERQEKLIENINDAQTKFEFHRTTLAESNYSREITFYSLGIIQSINKNSIYPEQKLEQINITLKLMEDALHFNPYEK